MKTILALLSREDITRLKNSSRVAQAMENAWARKISDVMEGFIPEAVDALKDGRQLPKIDLERILIEHYFDVSIKTMRYAQTESESSTWIQKGTGKKLASKPPAIKIPKGLAELMTLQDLWRRGKIKPRRPASIGKKIQKAYLDKIRSVWEKHSEDFRKGGEATLKDIAEKIKVAAKTTISRAKTIVRTENTSFYNEARKVVYDESPDITHYLFLAIRDAGTSPWCTPLTIDGMRGRSGLVYAKSDPLCDQERPACHPGCRSEYLPLNRLNPSHLRFIQDKSIMRRAHNCFPLLKGWN